MHKELQRNLYMILVELSKMDTVMSHLHQLFT